MRNLALIVALLSALPGLSGKAHGQAVPDAPQPQQKTPAKPQPPPAAPPPAKDENAFPEDVSRQAAKAAAADPAADPKPETNEANPFPEDVSRSAAKTAQQENAPAAKTDVPPGVSSSQSQGTPEETSVIDPDRARKDTQVGTFYLKTGDYRGALLRYQDAAAADPTNVDAIFGLAETQRSLGKKAEAAHEYQLYLDIVPNGPKAKEALKALKTLPPNK